ncbi:MAG: hypothetical protein M9928_23390 [Anaerolineae bacterium]|nr:hypothetical protein [Anaerolineae bacterium]
MENEWQVPGDKQLLMRETVRSGRADHLYGQRQRRQRLPDWSFVSFYEQCWLGFGTFFEGKLRCDLTEFRDSMPLPVGDRSSSTSSRRRCPLFTTWRGASPDRIRAGL